MSRDRDVVVLGSGNLGLVYLMEAPHRLTREEIDERHPELIPALRGHPHIGWLLVRSADHGAVVLGPAGERYLDEDRIEGEDPLAPFSATAATHVLRTDRFPHVADLMIGSFYDPVLDEGCAFEELISFHGGLGGPQTQAFILYPPGLPQPAEPILGAAAVHAVLAGWRRTLQGDGDRPGRPAPVASAATDQGTLPLTGTTPEIRVPLPGEETITSRPWTAPRRSSMLRRPTPA